MSTQSRTDSDIIEFADPNLKQGFAQVPRPVLKARGLSNQAKVVYALLLDYAWQQGSCFPGQNRLAQDLDVTERTIQRSLLELKDYQLIAWKRRGFTQTNVYKILDLSRNPNLTPPPTVSVPKNRSSRGDTTDLSYHEPSNLSYKEYAGEHTQGVANPHPLTNSQVSLSKFRKATHEEFSEKTSQGTGNPEPKTPHRSGFVPLASVLPASSVSPTGERRADQATSRVQTDKPAAASHPTGEEDRQLTSHAQPTTPGIEQSSGVSDVTHEPKRRQNRILERQASQPEPASQPPALSTTSAEQESQARTPQKPATTTPEQQRAPEQALTPAEATASEPVTTHTTAAETEPLSAISGRQNTSPAPARRRAARPAPQPTPDLAQEQAAEERAVVLAYIRDYATEFHDQASLKSSVTRAHRLFTDSGLPMEQWVSKLYEAHRITRERSAAIGYQGQGKKRSSETSSGLTNKMPYFFALLECVLGLHDHKPGHHPLPMTQQEFHRQQGRAGARRVAPAPASAEQTRQAPEAVAVVRTPLPRETEAHTLWQAVLEDLSQTITRPMFETYLAGTQGIAVENGQLVVSVPSDFTADWLSRKLAPLIQQTLARITGIAASVSFRVAQTPDTHPLASRLQQETQYAIRGYSP